MVMIWAADNNLLSQLDSFAYGTYHCHPLQILLQNHPSENTTYAILDGNIVNIALFKNHQLRNTISAQISSPLDLLYYISQIGEIGNRLELFGEITNDMKSTIAKRYQATKFVAQNHYWLTYFHNQH